MIGVWLLGVAFAEPPDARDAAALVARLLANVRAERVDADWLAGMVDDPARVGTWAQALRTGGPLARTLAAATDVQHASVGPDYVRLVLRSAPTLSVLVSSVDGSPRLRELSATSCVRCAEPTRFALDLFAEAARGAPVLSLLQPDLHMDFGELRSLEGLDPGWAVHALTERLATHTGLSELFAEADVVRAEGTELLVRYGDGAVDSWHLQYRDGTWRLRYHDLAADSPLRIMADDLHPIRRASRRALPRLHAWRPSWELEADGLIHLGTGVIGGVIQEEEQALLLGLYELDGPFSGVVALDLSTGAVRRRWQTPTPNRRVPRMIPGWTKGTLFAVDASGGVVVTTDGLSTPLKLTLRDNQLQPLSHQAGRLSALTFDADGELIVGSVTGRAQRIDSTSAYTAQLPDTVVALASHRDEIVALSRSARLDPGGEIVAHPEPCEAKGGGWSTYHSLWVITCAAVDGAGPFQLILGPQRAVPMVRPGGGEASAAWAPEGHRWIAADEDGFAALWYIDGRPPRRLPVPALRGVSWSASGQHVLLWNRHGSAWLWHVPREG